MAGVITTGGAISITVTLTVEEADLLAELLDGPGEELRVARLENTWLYPLIYGLFDAVAA